MPDTDPLARAREALIRAELVRSKGRSTPDTCPNCPPEAHVCHHEDEMRAWGDLPDTTYTNEQAADRAVAALAAADLLRDPAAETQHGYKWVGGGVVQTTEWDAEQVAEIPEVTHLVREIGPWRPVEDPSAKSETEEQQ